MDMHICIQIYQFFHLSSGICYANFSYTLAFGRAINWKNLPLRHLFVKFTLFTFSRLREQENIAIIFITLKCRKITRGYKFCMRILFEISRKFLKKSVSNVNIEISQQSKLNRRLQIQHFTQPDLRSTVKLRAMDQQIQFRIGDCNIPNQDLCPRLVTLVMKRSLGIWKTNFKPK